MNPFVRKRLVAHLTQTNWQNIILKEPELSLKQLSKLDQLIEKLNSGYPLDYILQKISFLDKEFWLEEGVLIPRPETEFWVKNLANKLQTDELRESSKSKFNQVLVDIGCGSGVIGLSLSHLFYQTYLLDISQKALKISQKNLENLQLRNCHVLYSNLLTEFGELIEKKGEKPNSKNSSKSNNQHEIWEFCIVANLPYLPSSDQEFAKTNRVDYEPNLALYSGDYGLDLFRQLLQQIQTLQKLNLKIKYLCFELDPRNIRLAQKELARILGLQSKIWLDQSGFERVLFVKT